MSRISIDRKTLAQKLVGPRKREFVIYILYGLEWAWLLNSASGVCGISNHGQRRINRGPPYNDTVGDNDHWRVENST